jgi:hypothetical protein
MFPPWKLNTGDRDWLLNRNSALPTQLSERLLSARLAGSLWAKLASDPFWALRDARKFRDHVTFSAHRIWQSGCFHQWDVSHQELGEWR